MKLITLTTEPVMIEWITAQVEQTMEGCAVREMWRMTLQGKYEQLKTATDIDATEEP